MRTGRISRLILSALASACLLGLGCDGEDDDCDPPMFYGVPVFCAEDTDCAVLGAGWYCDEELDVFDQCGRPHRMPGCVEDGTREGGGGEG